MPNRVCIIHVGTHKTGTSSLQAMLGLNRQRFKEIGLYFPTTGITREYSGNHELAWELMIPRFDGLVADLARALSNSPYNDAIISAEDLSLLHPDPTTFARFTKTIEDVGYQPKVVVYLRAQASYAESMYVERVKHEDIVTLEEFIETMLRTGAFPAAKSLPVPFAYAPLLQRYVDAVGAENVIVRPYPAGHGKNAIYGDFIGAMMQCAPSFDPTTITIEAPRANINESLSFGQVLAAAYLALNPQSTLPEDPAIFMERYCPEISSEEFDGRFALLTREEHARVSAHFAADVDAVAQRFGTRIPRATISDIASEDDPHWSLVRRERNVLDRNIEEWRKNH